MNFNTNQEEFQDKAFSILRSTEYKFKYLRHELGQISRGIKHLFDDSLVNISDDSWILIIHTDDQILIYGENWTDENLTEISEAFNFSRVSDITVSGDLRIIDRLTTFNTFTNITKTRDRSFYKSSAITRFEAPNLTIELAEDNDIDELAEMLRQYYHEEYNGENDKTIEEMTERVSACIRNQQMYVLKNQTLEILSFCTIINPDIGILFTNANQRRNGFGKILLSHCANLLLQENEEIYLMTVKTVTDSNIVATRVGFETFFECTFSVINVPE